MTRRRPITLLVTAALALTGLGACGGGGSGATCPAKVDTKTAVGGAITVCASEYKFDIGTIKAKPGPLKVTFENDGAIYHTFRIKGENFELKANGGKKDSGTVTLAKGTYDFDCSVAGHAAAGMKGKLEVG